MESGVEVLGIPFEWSAWIRSVITAVVVLWLLAVGSWVTRRWRDR
jgi:hypothetical protein